MHATAVFDDAPTALLVTGRILQAVFDHRRLSDPNLLGALAAHDPRFGIYGRRFTEAVDAVDAGRPEFVAAPTEDSVHTVWHEFHEDLLRTLGKERVE